MLDGELNLNMEFFQSTGRFLNTEEQLILGVSLNVLQEENHFRSTSFQAKIICSQKDYYIACGRGEDYIRNKMFFYSLDGRSWNILFPPSESDLAQFRLVRSLFTGDPTYVHRFHVGDTKVVIREENRLSAAIHLMDWETAAGPKGALEISTKGNVQKNPYFKGIRDAADLGSYVHHRLPKSPDAGIVPTENLCSAAGDSALEFLEPIARDYPPGTWILRSDSIRRRIHLHNLWWPGHTFHGFMDSGNYASIYIGFGVRNDDLPFML